MRPSHLTLIRGAGLKARWRRRGLPCPTLRVIAGGAAPQVEQTLAEAVETARAMRLAIEERIARALDPFDDRR